MGGADRGSRGVTVGVLVSVLLALGVALATRSAPHGSPGSAAAVLQSGTGTPQALAMGGDVPRIRQAAKPTWTITSRQLRVSYLDSVYFVDDQEGFVGGGGTLLVTHNGGAAWSAAPIPSVGGSIAAFWCTSASDCVAGGWTSTQSVQLLYTRDAGSTWLQARFPEERNLSHLTCWSPSNCVAVGEGLGQRPWEMQSTDGGKTWSNGAPPPGMQSLSGFVCSPSGSCLAGGGSQPFRNSGPDGNGVIDRSSDGGRTWQPVALPSVAPICSTPPGGTYTCDGPSGPVAPGTTTPSWAPTALSCPTPTICYEQNYGPNQLTSADGGATWQVGAPSGQACQQVLCFSYLPIAATFLTANDGWRTTYSQCGGFNFATEWYQSCPGDVEKTTDGGTTWVKSAETDYTPAISCPDQNHCWAVESTNSSGNVISTSDGGAHWTLVALPGTGPLAGMTCASPSLCFAVGSDPNGAPVVLRSIDGVSWKPSNLPPVSSGQSSPLFVGPQASYIGELACMTATACLASTTSQVFRTLDGGATWSTAWTAPRNANGATAAQLFGVACPSQSVCIAPTDTGLLRTTDGGLTWLPTGPGSAGSLSVVCAPGGLCLADDLHIGGENSTGILVSPDAGATWKAETINLPSGLHSNNFSSNSETLSQVYYLSCWNHTHCSALGLAYTGGGVVGWYVLNTGDAGRSWSVSGLPPEITQVGALDCSAGGQCLIAGSDTDGAGLWSLDGSDTTRLAGPPWSRFGQLTSLVCPASGRCLGTAFSNNATLIFAVSVPIGSASWTDSLPSPLAAFSNVEVDLTSAAVATGAALFITFPSQLFNLTFQENYAEIIVWPRRARNRLRRFARRLGLPTRTEDTTPSEPDERPPVPQESPDRSHLSEALLVVLTGALLGTLLDPHIAFNAATLEGYLGVMIAVLVSLGSIAVTLALYRSRRRLRYPLHIRALPLGLVVAAFCVIVSRLVNFEPGYLYGVVCGVMLASKLRAHEEAHIAALSTVVTLVVAAISWAVWVPVHHAAHHDGSFLVHVFDNALAALFISGLVNTVIVLFPLRFLAGWTVIRWRRDVWLAIFVTALFGVVAVLDRSPVSPGSHTSPVVVTISLFVIFAGGSVMFREHFARKWRRAHGVEVRGLRAHLRELVSLRPDEIEVVGGPGATQVVVEEEDPRG